MTEQGPIRWEALRIGCDEHTATIEPVLQEMKKYKLIVCSGQTVSIALLGSEYAYPAAVLNLC